MKELVIELVAKITKEEEETLKEKGINTINLNGRIVVGISNRIAKVKRCFVR